MLRGVALGLAVGFALTAPGFAADVVRPVVVPPPVVVKAHPFAGFYLGGHAGYGTANRNGCVEYGDFPVDYCHDDFDYDQKGWIIGGQTGYNHFFGPAHNLFIGAEVTASLSGITGNLDDFGDSGNGPGDWHYLATATAKLGWALDRLAIYGEVGVGLGGFNYGASACHFDSNHQGTVWGFGAEVATSSNNSLFVEWNRYDFQTKDASCQGLLFSTIGVRTDPRVDVVRFGFNHYFN
jgi:opacity protein-like surface antigen